MSICNKTLKYLKKQLIYSYKKRKNLKNNKKINR